MNTPTTLQGLVTKLRQQNHLRRNLRAMVKHINELLIKTGDAPVTSDRKGVGKERRFAKIAGKYVTLSDIANLSDEEAREDAMDVAITKALRDAPDVEAKVGILEDLHRLNTLRSQYERRGVSLSDPNFGQDLQTDMEPAFEKWIDVNNAGQPVTREQVQAEL